MIPVQFKAVQFIEESFFLKETFHNSVARNTMQLNKDVHDKTEVCLKIWMKYLLIMKICVFIRFIIMNHKFRVAYCLAFFVV